jgi:hypothetical protein
VQKYSDSIGWSEMAFILRNRVESMDNRLQGRRGKVKGCFQAGEMMHMISSASEYYICLLYSLLYL